MPYRTVAHGTILTPQDFQDLFDFVYDPATQAYRKLDDSFLSDAATDIKSRVATHFDELKVSKVSGLTVSWNAGTVRYEDGAVREISSGTLMVADNTTNYIYVNEDADVVSSTTEPSGLLLLAAVMTGGGIVNTVTDRRARWSVPTPFGGVSSAGQDYAILDLTDTPASYTGHGGKVLAIKQDESGIEFVARQSTSAGGYAVVDRIPVVDGQEITLSAGIATIQNDVPLMPKLTGSDPRVTSSGSYASSLADWKALDNALGTYDAWVTNFAPSTSNPAFWRFTFDSPVTIGRVLIAKRDNGPIQSPRDFQIRTSGDGTNFTTQLTITDQTYPALQNVVFALPAAVSLVTDLEIYITKGQPASFNDGLSGLGEIQAYSMTTASPGLGAVSGGLSRARKAVLAGIAILGGNAFVSCGLFENTDKILRIDTATRSINGDFSLDDSEIYAVITQSSSTGGSFSLSIQKDQKAAPIVASSANKIYIAINNEIKVYSSTNGNLIKTIDCGVATEIQGLGISEEQQKVYGASKAGAIVVIDTGTDTLSTTLTATDDAAFGGENYAVVVDDTRDAAYITSRSTNKVLVLNTVTDSLVTSINVGSTPEGIALSPSLGKAIVCNRTANTISVINTTNNTVGASVAMSAIGSGAQPTAAAIDEDNGKAVISLYAYHQVAIVDLTTNGIEGRAATAPNPVQAQFVPATNEIYVACEGGEITVIKRDN